MQRPAGLRPLGKPSLCVHSPPPGRCLPNHDVSGPLPAKEDCRQPTLPASPSESVTATLSLTLRRLTRGRPSRPSGMCVAVSGRHFASLGLLRFHPARLGAIASLCHSSCSLGCSRRLKSPSLARFLRPGPACPPTKSERAMEPLRKTEKQNDDEQAETRTHH